MQQGEEKFPKKNRQGIITVISNVGERLCGIVK